MPRPYLHATTNVGSLGINAGADSPLEVSQVRRNLINVMKTIKEEHGKYPDSFGIQESGTYDFNFAPAFSTPLATDEMVEVLADYNNITRGVVTYANPLTCRTMPPIDNKAEIVTTVHDIAFSNGRGKKEHKVGIINVYRLRNSNADCASIETIKEYIDIQREMMERDGIRKVVVHGDFNLENLSLKHFKEISHPDMYHKHKDGPPRNISTKCSRTSTK